MVKNKRYKKYLISCIALTLAAILTACLPEHTIGPTYTDSTHAAGTAQNSGKPETSANGSPIATTPTGPTTPAKPKMDASFGLERGEPLSDSKAGNNIGKLIGSAVSDEPVRLMCIENRINLRSAPDTTTSDVIMLVGLGQEAESCEVINGWYKVTVFPGGQQGYIASEYMDDYDPSKNFAAISYDDFGGAGHSSFLVDVKRYLPDIVYDMVFAYPDNFSKEAQYARDVCLLRATTVKKLVDAHEIFSKDGYTIKIYDAYRPSQVSGNLYKIVQNTEFVAKEGASVHNRGMAIDMTLVDKDGNELEMPSKLHAFDGTASRSHKGMTAVAKKNMDYMTSVMKKCGFSTIESEWWHFADSNFRTYDSMYIEFNHTPTEQIYYINYKLNGGINAAGNLVSYSLTDTKAHTIPISTNTFPLTIKNPTKKGYNFIGWTVEYSNHAFADITTPAATFSIKAGMTGDITLTANWSVALN